MRLILPKTREGMFEDRGKVEWRVLTDELTKERYMKRCNTYRVRMIGKLYHYAKTGNEEKFSALSQILTLHSKAFRV